ncbi:MAG: hypothetical protein ABJF50_08835 [Paracoccaceae bacterium]
MQLDVAHVLVSYPEDIRLIGLEPRKRGLFEILHDIGLLRFRGVVFDVERYDA